MCGQNAVAIAPQNQSGPGVTCGRGDQVGTPLSLDAAPGAQVAGNLERHDTGSGWPAMASACSIRSLLAKVLSA
jgi:hypothetical protein